MPDILIRDFPSDDLARLDEQAKRVGLSRSEYLRRRLHEQAQRTTTGVSAEDLRAFTGLLPDLDDDDIMRDAWS